MIALGHLSRRQPRRMVPAVAAALALLLAALPPIGSTAAETPDSADAARQAAYERCVKAYHWTPTPEGVLVWNGDNDPQDAIDRPFINHLPSDDTLDALYRLRALRESDPAAYADQRDRYAPSPAAGTLCGPYGGSGANIDNYFVYTPEQLRWVMNALEHTNAPARGYTPGALDGKGADIFLMADLDMGGGHGRLWKPIDRITANFYLTSYDETLAPYSGAGGLGNTQGFSGWNSTKNTFPADAAREERGMTCRTLYNLRIQEHMPGTLSAAGGENSLGFLRNAAGPTVLMNFDIVSMTIDDKDPQGGHRLGSAQGGAGFIGTLFGNRPIVVNNCSVTTALIDVAPLNVSAGAFFGRGDKHGDNNCSFRRSHTQQVYVRGGKHIGNFGGIIDNAGYYAVGSDGMPLPLDDAGWYSEKGFSDCYAVDGVVISAQGHSGGFVSCSNHNLSFRNCFTNNEVYGNSETGGFIGFCGPNTMFQYCYASGVVEGNFRLGGFIAQAANTGNLLFTDCYSTAMVGMQYEGKRLGGFVGAITNSATPRFLSCYAAGEVGSLDTLYTHMPQGPALNAVDPSAAQIAAESGTVGGFVGWVGVSTKPQFRKCLYDMQTTAMYNRVAGYFKGNESILTPPEPDDLVQVPSPHALPAVFGVYVLKPDAAGDRQIVDYFGITNHIHRTDQSGEADDMLGIHGVTTTGLTFGQIVSQAGITFQAQYGDTVFDPTADNAPFRFDIEAIYDGVYDTDANAHWAYALENRGLYPQLQAMAAPTTFLQKDRARVMAYSAASVCTVFVNDWAGTDPVDPYQEFFGSVRSLVHMAPFSSSSGHFTDPRHAAYAYVGNPRYRIRWQDETARNAPSQAFGAGAAPPVVVLSSGPAYEIAAYAPGIYWARCAVTVTDETSGRQTTGYRLLRLVPVAYFDAGADTVVRVDSGGRYDHRADTRLVHGDAPALKQLLLHGGAGTPYARNLYTLGMRDLALGDAQAKEFAAVIDETSGQTTRRPAVFDTGQTAPPVHTGDPLPDGSGTAVRDRPGIVSLFQVTFGTLGALPAFYQGTMSTPAGAAPVNEIRLTVEKAARGADGSVVYRDVWDDLDEAGVRALTEKLEGRAAFTEADAGQYRLIYTWRFFDGRCLTRSKGLTVAATPLVHVAYVYNHHDDADDPAHEPLPAAFHNGLPAADADGLPTPGVLPSPDSDPLYCLAAETLYAGGTVQKLSAAAPLKPSCLYFDFVGWSTVPDALDEEGTWRDPALSFDPSTPIFCDTILYAQWVPRADAAFNGSVTVIKQTEGGTAADRFPVTVTKADGGYAAACILEPGGRQTLPLAARRGAYTIAETIPAGYRLIRAEILYRSADGTLLPGGGVLDLTADPAAAVTVTIDETRPQAVVVLTNRRADTRPFHSRDAVDNTLTLGADGTVEVGRHG